MAIISGLTPYSNFVLEEQLKDLLTTKFDVNRLFITDNSLTIEPGMIVKVHKYRPAGSAEKVAKGYGNSSYITSAYTEEAHEVACYQSVGVYNDEDSMTDSKIVESLLMGISQSMVKQLNKDAIAELAKASQKEAIDTTSTTANYLFGKISHAIAEIKKGLDNFSEQGNLAIYIHPDTEEWFRTQLVDNLKYTEDFVRTGAIGGVCGVPVYCDTIFPSGCVIIEDKEAMTNYGKEGVEVEQKREPNERANYVFSRYYNVLALTNDAKLFVYAPAVSDTTDYTFSGATAAGTSLSCEFPAGIQTLCVKVYNSDGELVEDNDIDVDTTLTSKSVTLTRALVSGDNVNVTFIHDGFKANVTKTATVS